MIATTADLVVDRWGARFMGQRFACAVGRGGIRGDKREGDGASPRGRFRLIEVFYRADRCALPDSALPVRQLSPWDIWRDDPAHAGYNHHDRGLFARGGHERMCRGDGLYDIVVTTDHNWPDASPGAGSAIFVHCWRGPRVPTAGCIAFAQSDLRAILARWRPDGRLMIR